MLRRTIAATMLLSTALAASACHSPDARGTSAGRAVVVFAADRAGDAELVATRLRDDGFTVATEPEGPATRTHSSAAVYLAGREPRRVERVTTALAPVAAVELLPFVQAGPEGTDVVVWLVSRERDAAHAAAPAK